MPDKISSSVNSFVIKASPRFFNRMNLTFPDSILSKKRNSCIIFILSTICLLMLDQFTKYLALTYLKNGNSMILIPGVFQLHYLENRGAAFGMMQGNSIFLSSFVTARISSGVCGKLFNFTGR